MIKLNAEILSDCIGIETVFAVFVLRCKLSDLMEVEARWVKKIIGWSR